MSFKEIENNLPQNWEIKKAEEVCGRVTDGTHDSPKKKDEGKYLITSRHLNDNSIDLKNAYFISEKDFNKVNERSKVEQWDVLFSMIGTIGETYIEKNCEIEYAIKNIGLFKMNNNELMGKWMYYYLNSKFAKEYIYTHKRGSTQQFLPLGSLRNFPIIIPKNKEIQNKIIIILDSIQNKIENNNKINQTLEEMAQAIYKSWFVDFELFQEGEFIESKLGMIPKCWEVKNISDVVNITYGKNLAKKNMSGSGYKVFSASGLVGYHKDYLYKKPQILMTCRGSGCGDIYESSPKSFVTNNCLVFETNDDTLIDRYYLRLFLLNSNRDQFITGSAQPQITITNISKMKILIPSEKYLNNFTEIISGFINKINSNKIENQSLKELRDTLLPKLMSGEIKLPLNK